MLKLVTGKPGSGKTYYIVWRTTEALVYDPIANTYDIPAGTLLLSNLAGLRANAVDLDAWIKRDGLTAVFDYELWEKEIAPKYKKIIVIIDEAQRLFPDKGVKIDNSVFFWFEYHRHFGCDVYLATQAAASVNRRVLAIGETYIQAQPSSMRSTPGYYSYSLRDSTTNEVVSAEKLRVNKRVFRAYKSATHAMGLAKQKNYLVRIFAIGIVVLVLGIIATFFGIQYTFKEHAQKYAPQDAADPAPEKPKTLPVRLQVQSEPKPIDNGIPEYFYTWASSGISPEEFRFLPPGCTPRTSVVACPPATIPTQVVNLYKDKSCVGKACTIYIPLRGERGRERMSEQASESLGAS